MWFSSWLRNRKRRASPRQRPTFRPMLEALEERWVLSTLTVMNNLDSGAGSLRADIAAAQKNDTIVFAPNLDDQTITLTSGELLINKNLTITGPGAGELTISGDNASRVFEVAKGKQVALSGLTISAGAASGGRAGGGGGIENHGTLTVSGSTLFGNSASYGGGISNYGTATISGSTLSGNSAIREGGGIYDTTGSGTTTVSNSSAITGNTAPIGFGADVFNAGVLYEDGSSTIGILNGNHAVPI